MLDAQVYFEPLAGTAVTASADSTNTIDLGSLKDAGAGNEIEMHVLTKTAFTAAGAATLVISLQASSDNATFYDVIQSPLYAKAALTAGVGLFKYQLPLISQLNYAGSIPAPRYIKLRYTVATGPFTAGSLAAWLTGHFDRDFFKAYPNNYVTA